MVNRDDIERQLAEINAKATAHFVDYSPHFPDYAVREMFLQGVVDHFGVWFDKHGWPQEMPDFVFLPPIEIPQSRGFTGYYLPHEEYLWEMKQVDGKFVAVA